MTVIGGIVVEREIPDVGLLRFEDCDAGEWLTKEGNPAKKPRRRYLLDGNELESVSSIVDTMDKPALVRWAEDHGARGGAKAALLGELDGVPDEEILGKVISLGLGATNMRDEAADRGTAIHLAGEKLANGDPLKLGEYPLEWRGWIKGLAGAWLELGLSPLEVEQIVCHKKLGYAGRPDFVGIDRDKRRVLVDYKSGKGKVYDSAHFQTRLYEMARIASGHEEVDRIVIVGVNEDGSHQIVDCEIDDGFALALLNVYRGRKHANAGMAKQRAEKKKAAKESAKSAVAA
jgi:hypothetical protein